MKCPVCSSLLTSEIVHSHSIEAAAEHFIPSARSPERHRRLIRILRQIWLGSEVVEIHRCGRCGFGFPIPYVAGNAEFYNLVSNGDPHYPRRRWEFDRTLAYLRTLAYTERVRLLEAGAGNGWFLRQLLSSAIGYRFDVLALEYDDGALRSLKRAGIQAQPGSITQPGIDGVFGVICLFQTLEHMDDVQGAFAAFKRLGAPRADIFISVPYGPAIDIQEQVTRFWDMPPNHVGRWSPSCFEFIARQHGLEIVGQEVEPLNAFREAVRMSIYRVNSGGNDRASLAARIQGLPNRPLRGILKRALAVAYLPTILLEAGRLRGNSMWTHLRLP